METNIINALVCILGALVALWIAFMQLNAKLNGIIKHGIHKSIGLMVSEDDIRRLANLVLDELKRRDGHES